MKLITLNISFFLILFISSSCGKKDTIPPDTIIISKPPDPADSPSATFRFKSTEAGSSFECKLDDAEWSSCTSPKKYFELSVGSHTFNVRAKDKAGNIDPTPASWTWTIIDTPPIFSGLRDVLVISETEVMLFWEPATDNMTPASEILYEICMSTTAGSCAADFNPVYTVGSNIWNYKIDGLNAEETYYFLVRARDNKGNRDNNTFEKKREFLRAIQVLAGYAHTCALLTDNTIKCWGNNWDGELGDGTNIHSSIPISVLGINNALQITAGGYHTCAKLSDNLMRCWGNTEYGQVGIGYPPNPYLPVPVIAP